MSQFYRKQRPDRSLLKRQFRIWLLLVLFALFIKVFLVDAYEVPTASMENTILRGDFLLGKKFIYGVRLPERIGIPGTPIGIRTASKHLPGLRKPEKGDLIIFKFPVDPSFNYVKRCIAGPGQTVEIRKGQVMVDQKPYPLPGKGILTGNFLASPLREPDIFPEGAGNRDYYGPVRVPAKGDILRPGEVNMDIIRNVAELAGHQFEATSTEMFVDGKLVPFYVVEQDHYFVMGDNRHDSYDSRYWGFVPFNLVIGKTGMIYFSRDKSRHKIRLNRIFRIPR